MSRCNFYCDDYIDEARTCGCHRYQPRNCCYPNYPKQDSCCCTGPRGPQGPMGASGLSAYQIALANGFTGTAAEWLNSLRGATGATGATGPFLSSHMVAFASGQPVASNASIVFDAASVIKAGNGISINQAGTVITINRPGLYHVEWTVNLAAATPSGVIGLLENGEMLSGAASSASGSFSSGTVINVTTVPYTLSLHNFNSAITIENPTQWQNGAASIRIVRYADGPSV